MKKGNIVTKLEKVMVDTEKMMKKNSSYASLDKANDLYNKLISDGTIKKRGNTLKGLDDNHLYRYQINSKS